MRTLKDCSNDIIKSAQSKGIKLTDKDVLDLMDRYERELKSLDTKAPGDPEHKAIVEKILKFYDSSRN